ncbi:Methylates the class 1 translation termination release factors RF1 PrfA and RF2 PrfB on the glutamine residue of the universally conserved GGQ motif (By similarity) [Seminavis robusta]|uniref:Methylates the class 1 translation termination release factors RF1 PrfA and RF2 PrfB on the glutamine residue of the universally conserved GGQ motif By similarity n=1 Tax=Seminavis robusta TaxID=568900 RepID=A0A9N8DT46_9STRA|nr:Methylates the class 1 translation termination release factors RF1 PrfA and RF2 PrfB on the glutamine residue of the universally conserved GGQ motif (By similarity) [Seminavis robusta]|eukprot:Sro352_g124180.1 Methylates the class 1 translation termination release factors RF1 PrfA and RF2 PrfB on the glutamine residue of the universally conserved GGQ motif (By similarity) (623) ;mRNA; f:27040-28908
MAQWFCLLSLALLSSGTGFVGVTRPSVRRRIRLSNHQSDASSSLQEAYQEAREIRTLQGHESALLRYQQILKDNPDDWTAGTRIAAAQSSPRRQDLACNATLDDVMSNKSEIQLLQKMLSEHNYTHQRICDFFGIKTKHEDPTSSWYCSCEGGPLFLTPATPGSVSKYNHPLAAHQNQKQQVPSAVACLITLFLLSLAVPKKLLEASIGEESMQRMQKVGWVYPCEINSELMVPYVHVFPVDFVSPIATVGRRKTLWFVTDLHPRVLSATTVGTGTDKGNAVMYIGPDSLALAQHFDPYSYLSQRNCYSDTTSPPTILNGLDLCTGSGIQALAAITQWKLKLESSSATSSRHQTRLHMTAVDINPRALRFTLFNAILNGLEHHIQLVQADLVSGSIIVGKTHDQQNLEDYFREGNRKYQLILANPPFLPVPPPPSDAHKSSSEMVDAIDQRYGLFSSGGASGEVVLQRIIEVASRHLEVDGVAGVVSEFFLQSQDPHYERFSKWWTGVQSSSSKAPGRAVLFVNENPITAQAYAERRADNPQEAEVWMDHLKSLNVTTASPGMLYTQKQPPPAAMHRDLDLMIVKVPKTSQGSVWTPSNYDATQYTQLTTRKIFDWPLNGDR